MPDYITQCIIATADNTVANFATNTFAIEATDVVALGLAHTALATFYQTIDANMSNLVRSANGLEVTSYNRADTKPRAPVLTNFSALTTTGTAPLPPEVALCLSFQAARVSGVPQSRRRGRIYLPFFDETGNGTDGRPASGVVSSTVTAAQAFLDASDASATWAWNVWSTVNGSPSIVANGWVDNEWDTQRRRGRPATSRTVFS